MSSLSGTEKIVATLDLRSTPLQERSLLDNGGMRNSGDLKLPIKQARKVFVLECLQEGKMTNREAARSDAGLKRPLPQFGRVLHTLDIQPIEACSPQAKGRIERLWNTLQDRLTTETPWHQKHR